MELGGWSEGKHNKAGRPDAAAQIDERDAKEPDGWRKRRLLLVKLAAKGDYTSGEVAELCGVARTYPFAWLKIVHEGGLEALLMRAKPGLKEGSVRGIPPEVMEALRQKPAAHEFASAQAAQRWLKKEHGIQKPYKTVWNWLKNCTECCGCRGRRHSKKRLEAVERFKNELAGKFEALELQAGSRVQGGFMDEHALGCTPSCGGSGHCAGCARW